MRRLGALAGGCLSLLLASSAQAGGRAQYGGTLRIGAVSRSLEDDPLLADTPVEATLLQLTTTPVCLLGELSRPTPGTVHLAVAPMVSASSVLNTLQSVRASSSPYAALLAGVKSITAVPGGVELQLSQPGADLEHALCHPALAVPLGPFKADDQRLTAVAQFPEGRPYLDAATVSAVDARSAERLLSQRRLDVVLGAPSTDDAPQLYATYLVTARPDLRLAIEQGVDRADLTRFFVRGPASPMPGLLPPSLGGATAAAVRPPSPPMSSRQDVALLYDASLADQRAVAERLQVKLQPLGYRVALEGVSRKELRSRWHQRKFDLMLNGVLLPPAPGPALAVVLALAGRLEALDVVNSAPDRDTAAREAAVTLQPSLPLVPLYVQGLGVAATGEVQHLTRDALGLVRLADAFLATE